MFMKEISFIVRQMRVFAERNMTQYDLGFPEQLILMYLSERESSNQEQIARYLSIDKGAIAKTIAKLEKKNLVSSKTNVQDRREKTVALTPTAYSLLEKMEEVFADWEDRAYQGIEGQEKHALEQTIAVMAKNLKELS